MTTTMKKHLSINELADLTIGNIEKVFTHFGIDYRRYNNKIISNCPIHAGDNTGALNLYTDGKFKLGNWKCWTHQCEKKFGSNIFGFIRGLLDNNNEASTFQDAIKWINLFFGTNSKSIKSIPKLVEKEKVSVLSQGMTTKSEIRTKLLIPPKYYLDRGFLSSTLNYFDVGLCIEKGPFYTRIVVPIYKDNGFDIAGLVSRSTQPQCKICNLYHYINRACPQNDLERFWSSKWLNNKGFHRANCFYNYWNAKKYIQESEEAILVEGQGDVWRLYEAGFYNTLGMFGCELTIGQMQILAKSGVKRLWVLTDSDEAGIISRDKIRNKCKNLYDVRFKDLPQKDIGDMNVRQVKEIFV